MTASPAPAHDAVFTFEYDDQHRARIVERSIRPELGEIDDDRSRASLSRAGGTVTVRIKADDLVALRAVTNTWCSFVAVVEQVIDADGPVGG